MAEQKVNIDIRTKGAKKSQKDISGLSRSVGSLGRSVLNAGAAYFGARGLINGLSESLKLAGIQELAEKKLETALGRTSQALLDQASALQKVSSNGDEAIITQQAFLASLDFSEKQIKSIIPVAMDLAAATGMTLETAVRNTAKTFSGLAGELGELVPQLRNLTSEQMKAGDAVEIMAKLFGGQALAQTKTYAGSVDQLTLQLSDMGEQIGMIVIPVFEKLAPHLRTAIDFWSTYLDVGKNTEIQTEEYTRKINSLNGSIKYQSDLIKGLTSDSLSQNGVSEKGLDLIERAAIEGREPIEQLKQEKILIGGLITQKYNLIAARKEEAEQKKLALDQQKEEIYLSEYFGEIRRSENDFTIEAVENKGLEVMEGGKYLSQLFQISKEKKASMQQDLKNAALSGQSAKDAMKSVVRAESMEAVAGYISSVLKTVPFPANIILAAGGGALVSGMIDKGLSQFADGGVVPGNPSAGDSVPSLLTPGEVILNASQQQGLLSGMGGVTVNIQGNMIGNEEFVRDTLIPEIDRTVNRGLA